MQKTVAVNERGLRIDDDHPMADMAETLIMTWYHWARAHRPALGYPGKSPMFWPAKMGMTRDESIERDERDARIARQQAEQVDVCIDELPTWQMRSAVGLHAASKAAGAKVFRNPRMSAPQQHAAYLDAKALLIPKFIRRGLMREEQRT